jgi:hypothetical protein
VAGERKVSEEERAVVRWLLANCALKDVSAYRVEALDEARVIPGCTCGCASVNFVFADSAAFEKDHGLRRGTDIVAEAFALWPDGARADVMLWGCEGRLLGIELTDLGSDAAERFPTVEVLRRWEDYFPADA